MDFYLLRMQAKCIYKKLFVYVVIYRDGHVSEGCPRLNDGSHYLNKHVDNEGYITHTPQYSTGRTADIYLHLILIHCQNSLYTYRLVLSFISYLLF